jgi:hypothetical protein
MAESAHSIRNGTLCALTFAACYWAAYPVAEMGFIDDWSYIRTAQIFAETGHVAYNGWASPILGWQIPWGALFIHLFGFSFTAVKLSTLPIAMATVFLLHAILIRFGSTARNAVIGALTVGLSPLFIPLAASYMTDVPGLFAIVLCIYGCQRAAAAGSSAGTIAWLCAAAALNLAGGTARQIAWLGALVMAPATGWFLRKRHGVLLAACVIWIISIAAIVSCLRWFQRQPYSVPESAAIPHPLELSLLRGAVLMCGSLLCLALVIYPILVPWMVEICKTRGRTLAAAVLIVLSLTALQWAVKWSLPWIPNVIFCEFAAVRVATSGSADSSSFMLPFAARLILSALVVSAVTGFFFTARGSLRRLSRDSSFVFWLLVPFSAAYLVLLVPRAIEGAAFDRYLLGLMPSAVILPIWIYERRIAPNLPAISAVTLALFALLAVAGDHDWFAWQRARLAAINEVRASGVPRGEIQGGFEYDGWTEIEETGHVNNPGIRVPPGAYNPNPRIPQVADACKLDFASFTPEVHPKYSVVFGPKACLLPSKYPSVKFLAWLPPFQRWISVQEIPAR